MNKQTCYTVMLLSCFHGKTSGYHSMHSFQGTLPFEFLQFCSLEFHIIFSFHSWRQETVVLPIITCAFWWGNHGSGLEYTVVRICLSVWADQAHVTTRLYHGPWYATPNSWQPRNRISRSSKASLAAALSDDAVYSKEYDSNFNYVFEEKLQNCNEHRLPRDHINPVQNARLIHHFSAVG